MKEEIFSDKRKANLAFKIFDYLYKKDKFSALVPYIKYSEPKTGVAGEKLLKLESDGGEKLVVFFKSFKKINRRKKFTTCSSLVYDTVCF